MYEYAEFKAEIIKLKQSNNNNSGIISFKLAFELLKILIILSKSLAKMYALKSGLIFRIILIIICDTANPGDSLKLKRNNHFIVLKNSFIDSFLWLLALSFSIFYKYLLN